MLPVFIAFALGIAALGAWSFVVVQRAIQANPPRGVFVSVPGGRMHVRDMGPRDAPGARTVVLIHGASCNHAALVLPLGEALVKAGYRVVAVDRPGHGHSDRPSGRDDASPAAQARHIEAVIAAMELDRPILLAHSLAGALALDMALAEKPAIGGLLLVAPVSHPWPGGITWYYHPASWPVIGPIFSHLLPVPGAALTLRQALDGVFTPQTPPENYARDTQLDLLLRPANFRANAEDVAALLAHVTAQAPHYGRITLPLTVLFGKQDRVVWPEIHAEGLRRQVGHARIVLLDSVGHVPHHADPQAVVAELDALARIRTAQP